MPEFRTLTATVDGRVGRLTLNQPEKLNPLGSTTLRELIDAAAWFDATDAAVVIVSGAGRAFSAGFDLREFGGTDRAADGDAHGDHDGDHDAANRPTGGSVGSSADLGRRMADAVEQMEALTIAAIAGPCIGGGVVLVSACDMRIAADDTTFAIPEVDLGIPLTWGGIPRLVRVIGPAMTCELVLTCRPFDAEEARSMGFVNRVVARDDLESTIDELAASLTHKAPSIVATTKRQVLEAAQDLVSTAGSWADVTLMEAALRDPEARAAARDYLARRTR